MKKFLLLLVLAIVGIYGIGRIRLGEAGAMRFLAQMEAKMTEGKGEEVCEMFHDDLEVAITDHTGDSVRETSGGKDEFCDLTATTAAGLNLVPHSSTVNLTEVESKQSWLHPWTSEVSYLENRSLSIRGAGVTIRTVSEDEITLVHTFSGVKLRKIKSEIYEADAT
ncbi:MAG TPA: hypothetical protein VFU13_05045 [Steroidobacteraceae bacterium]|nr:hypothetical protein [Steroidobacteraceae bacterium]